MTWSTAAEHAWCSASEEGFVVIFRQTRGLQRFPHRSGNHHDNINHTNIFGPREDSRKNRWTSSWYELDRNLLDGDAPEALDRQESKHSPVTRYLRHVRNNNHSADKRPIGRTLFSNS